MRSRHSPDRPPSSVCCETALEAASWGPARAAGGRLSICRAVYPEHGDMMASRQDARLTALGKCPSRPDSPRATPLGHAQPLSAPKVPRPRGIPEAQALHRAWLPLSPGPGAPVGPQTCSL